MMNVMVVEDEPQLLQNIASYLNSFEEDIDVLTASSAEEGLEILESGCIVDVMLTDVLLPGIDGIELVRRTVREWPDLRIVVMTGLRSPEIKTRALRDGALRFIEKPIDMENLKPLIDEMTQPRRGWSGAVCDLDIFDLTQLFLMTRKRRAVRVAGRDSSGVLVFEAGTLTHASTPGQQGAAAFCEMIGWEGGTFEEIPNGHADHPPNVRRQTTRLMLDAARLRDENGGGTTVENHPRQQTLDMSKSHQTRCVPPNELLEGFEHEA